MLLSGQSLRISCFRRCNYRKERTRVAWISDERQILPAHRRARPAAIVLGAFGAHALSGRLFREMLALSTAVDHFQHALGMLGVGVLMAVA
jgi:hypothetical protein